jgi:hypothetical protein
MESKVKAAASELKVSIFWRNVTYVHREKIENGFGIGCDSGVAREKVFV